MPGKVLEGTVPPEGKVWPEDTREAGRSTATVLVGVVAAGTSRVPLAQPGSGPAVVLGEVRAAAGMVLAEVHAAVDVVVDGVADGRVAAGDGGVAGVVSADGPAGPAACAAVVGRAVHAVGVTAAARAAAAALAGSARHRLQRPVRAVREMRAVQVKQAVVVGESATFFWRVSGQEWRILRPGCPQGGLLPPASPRPSRAGT